MPDGGPLAWAMTVPLVPAPGMETFSHCQDAARMLVDVAGQLLRSGELQHRKAYAIM